MLEINHLKKTYNKKLVVDDICLTIHKGDVLGLIGSNGAGKSTTLSMIATLIKPDSGDILYKGKSIVKSPNQYRSILGFVPQEIALYQELTGMDNLIFWGKAYDLTSEELKNRVEEVIQITGLEKEVLKGRVKEYSGGMKRRLNIGVALLHQPELVIMDEPTVGIDVVSRTRILDTILKINQMGTTVIYTGHYMEEMEKICSQICIMEAGKIIISGEKEELLQKGKNRLEEFYINMIN